jgi:dTDP-4-amino-4,6-dideoxygalactose transaminase
LAQMPYNAAERGNYQYVVVEVDEAKAGLARDEIVRVLHAENVLARKYFWPGCHRMEPYRSLYPYASMFLPETERVAARVIVLPTGAAMSEADIGQVCAILRSALAQSAAVRAALSKRP